MYNPRTNEITFPHTIPKPVYKNKRYTWDDVNGGSKRLADLCIEPNLFWGGGCETLGWIKELGLYGVKAFESTNLLGFYVHEPEKLTDMGRELVKDAFPDKNVKFELYAMQTMTREERRKLRELRQSYIDNGMPPEIVSNATAEELEVLLKAMESGKAEKPMAVAAETTVAPLAEEDDIEVKHNGSVLKGRATVKIKGKMVTAK